MVSLIFLLSPRRSLTLWITSEFRLLARSVLGLHPTLNSNPYTSREPAVHPPRLLVQTIAESIVAAPTDTLRECPLIKECGRVELCAAERPGKVVLDRRRVRLGVLAVVRRHEAFKGVYRLADPRAAQIVARFQAALLVVWAEMLVRAVLLEETVENLLAELATVEERHGEEDVRAYEPCNVDNTDGERKVISTSLGHLVLIVWTEIELLEIGNTFFHETVDLVLVSEANARGNGIERD